MNDLQRHCVKRLSDVCRPVGGGTPSRSQPKYWNGDIPWASVKDFTDDSILLTDTQEHITQDGLESSASTVVPKDTPIVCTRMAVGRCALTTRSTAINQDLKALLLNDEFHLKFFIRLLRFHGPDLDRLSIGSTVRGITTSDLLALPLKYPLKLEQSRIAAVLDTVDESIARTEAVIAKLRQVRAGMLHDLLSRGLDEHGQLRDPIAHPEQFQDSPLGQIPKEWNCKTLQESADWFSGGTPSRSQPSWWTGDVPILTPKDMKVFEISDTIEHVTEEAAIAGSKVMPPDTAFIVVRGMILAHTFPVCLSTRPFAFNQDIKAVRGREDLKTRFLAHWFAANASAFLRKTTEATHGTKKLDSKELHHSQIGVPEAEEQDAIVGRIEAFNSAIAGWTAELGKLNLLKSGLMNDLLTGRVRVPEGIVGAG